MKQLYRVPFQRNSDIVKEARFQYVQRIMEFEAEGAHHKFIFVDEASFNLCKVRRRGRNIIGQRATVTVSAQPRIMMQFLPAYSPFLNPIEEFFSAWRWKVYDHRPYEQMPLLEAMNAGCLAIGAEDCQGWIRHARRIHTLPHTGGRGKIFGIEQESAIVDMVVANNAIRLREIQAAVIADQGVFRNIKSVSLATIDRVLKLNHVRMKQLYRVPFQRNSDIVKEARFQYVQRIMEFEAEGAHHKFIFVDEAGFNLCKVRRRRRNITGQRATVTVPDRE
ncbi:hypothetical protein ROHU_010722 [Labeo rohita]|uniref:Tc1-like transposase DDE domain-containing protein n=1 Tax=Labeo rohita TaxID=84645 RepID=A0A498LS65_LABRO|nr:hypothetical protein ROHU_010722 [Labeo rohita]